MESGVRAGALARSGKVRAGPGGLMWKLPSLGRWEMWKRVEKGVGAGWSTVVGRHFGAWCTVRCSVR